MPACSAPSSKKMSINNAKKYLKVKEKLSTTWRHMEHWSTPASRSLNLGTGYVTTYGRSGPTAAQRDFRYEDVGSHRMLKI
jgi:hypothetical protein